MASKAGRQDRLNQPQLLQHRDGNRGDDSSTGNPDRLDRSSDALPLTFEKGVVGFEPGDPLTVIHDIGLEGSQPFVDQVNRPLDPR